MLLWRVFFHAHIHLKKFNFYSFLKDRVQAGEGQREGDTESEAGSRF